MTVAWNYIFIDDENQEVYRLCANPEKPVQDKISKSSSITLTYDDNKVKRNISVQDKVEEDWFSKLFHNLSEIEQKHNTTPGDIADIFVKVSGDLDNLARHFEGHTVPMWTYLEDLALTRPQDSMEYHCLVESKGKEEIEKRKNFLLKTGN